MKIGNLVKVNPKRSDLMQASGFQGVGVIIDRLEFTNAPALCLVEFVHTGCIRKFIEPNLVRANEAGK